MKKHPFVDFSFFSFEHFDTGAPSAGGVVREKNTFICHAIEGDSLCSRHNGAIQLLHDLAFAFEQAAPEAFSNFFFPLLKEKGLPVPSASSSDGSSADYYKLPSGCEQLQDLISFCDMNGQIAEIFRACYRYGRAEHSPKLRDAKKIRFYAEAEVQRLEAKELKPCS